MNLQDFQVGDLLVLTYRTRLGDDQRAAAVSAVDYNGNGLVTFCDRYGSDLLPAGQGAFNPIQVGATPFGCVAVEKVGHYKPVQSGYASPRPGDRAYDLMC